MGRMIYGGSSSNIKPSYVIVHTGVIKGSEQAIDCDTGYIDKTTYISLSDRIYPIFSGYRERIYQLFECYIKLKRQLRHYDAPDRFVFVISSS